MSGLVDYFGSGSPCGVGDTYSIWRIGCECAMQVPNTSAKTCSTQAQLMGYRTGVHTLGDCPQTAF